VVDAPVSSVDHSGSSACPLRTVALATKRTVSPISTASPRDGVTLTKDTSGSVDASPQADTPSSAANSIVGPARAVRQSASSRISAAAPTREEWGREYVFHMARRAGRLPMVLAAPWSVSGPRKKEPGSKYGFGARAAGFLRFRILGSGFRSSPNDRRGRCPGR
jgi:hypothetical protein